MKNPEVTISKKFTPLKTVKVKKPLTKESKLESRKTASRLITAEGWYRRSL